MSPVGDFVALRVNGEELTLHDLVCAAKVYGGESDFLESMVATPLVRAASARMGITVSDRELQEWADNFRIARKLYSAQATLDWLAANNLQQEDWEYVLENALLNHKLMEALFAGKAEQYFAEHKRDFDAATILQIFVPEEDVARELRAQCVEDRAPFLALSRPFASTRFLGTLFRCEMEKLVAAAVFGVQPGEVAGPVKTERGWCLAFVETLHPATLDAKTRSHIASELHQDWRQEERRKAIVEKPLLTEI